MKHPWQEHQTGLGQAQANEQASMTLLGTFRQWGTTHVVCSPGSRNTPLILAAAALFPAEHIHMIIDERSAAFVALGLAQATRQAPLLMCTSGSALGHWLPALMEAYHACLPLLCLSADRPPMLQDFAAPQTTRQFDLFAHHTRWNHQSPVPCAQVPLQYWRQLAKRAHGEAHGHGGEAVWRGGWGEQRLQEDACAGHGLKQGRAMGPIHLNLPFDEPLWQTQAKPIEPQSPPEPSPSTPYATPEILDTICPPQIRDPNPSFPSPSSRPGKFAPADRARAAQWMACWRNQPGLVYAAGDAAYGHQPAYGQAVVALAQALGWPLVVEPFSPLAHQIGQGEPLLPAVGPLLQRLLALPLRHVLWLGQVPIGRMGLTAIGPHATRQVWHLATHALGIDPMLADVHAWSGHLPTLLQALLEQSDHPSHSATQGGSHQPSLSQLAKDWQRTYQGCFEAMTVGQQGWWEIPVVDEVIASVPSHALALIANSLSVRDVAFARRWPEKHLTLYAHRGVNGIDGHIAAACGLALAAPQRPVLVLLGDVAFAHDVGSLQLLHQLHRGKVVVVVLINGGGAIFDTLPVKDHPHHQALFRTPPKLTPSQIAASMGWLGLICNTPEAIGQRLSQAWQGPQRGVVVEINLGAQTFPMRQRFLQELERGWNEQPIILPHLPPDLGLVSPT